MASKRYVVGGSGQHAGFGRTSLASLDDMNITNPQPRDELRYTAGKWTNRPGLWIDPVISLFDNTLNLPVTAGVGDRYIAGATANGWTAGNVYECTVAGGNGEWSLASTGLTNLSVSSLAVIGTKIFAGTAGGVFLSTNYGTTWAVRNTGLTDTIVLSLLAVGTALFAGTATGGIFKTANDGTLWAASNGTGLNVIPTPASVPDMKYMYTTMFVIASDIPYTSVDGGANWAALGTVGLPANLVAILPSGAAYLYVASMAGGLAGGVFRTVDQVNWTHIDTGLPGPVKCMVFQNPYLYAGSPMTGLYRSDDFGDTWTQIIAAVAIETLTFIGARLYISVGGSLRFSDDYGDTVITRNTGLGPLIVYPIIECGIMIFAGTSAGGVYNSLSGIAAWPLVTSPLDGMATYSQLFNVVYYYDGSAWSTANIRTSDADPAPGQLIAKLEAGMAMGIVENTTDPANYKATLSVDLGTLSDQAAAGDDARLGHFYSTLTSQAPAAPLAEVYYGTGNPPSAVGIVNGSLYFKYTP